MVLWIVAEINGERIGLIWVIHYKLDIDRF